MNHLHFQRSSATQRGAALVVGLLLLLVLTLLAISGVNTASMELTMAGNMQYQQNAFQSAETGIAQALDTGAFNPGDVPQVQADVPMAGSAVDFYSTTVTPQLGGAPQAAIWGNSWDSFSTYHFEIQSLGTSTVRNARAANFQGVAVIAPLDTTVMPAGSGSTTLN